jgi:hypothetical protein
VADPVLQLRRGTAARWTELNPILEAGRPGCELDTGRMKFGDGVKKWSDLPYVSGGGTDSPPSGTGVRHMTAGVEDPVAKLIDDTDFNVLNVDGGTGKASIRTLGTGSTQACAGDDPRLSDARTPLEHEHAAVDITDLDDATQNLSGIVELQRKFFLLLKQWVILGLPPPVGLEDDLERALATE